MRRINAKMKADNLFSLMIAFSVRLTGTKYGCGGGGRLWCLHRDDINLRASFKEDTVSLIENVEFH